MVIVSTGDFLFLDTCQAHAHQHAKMALLGLSKHICAHYSACNLDRLENVRHEKLTVMVTSLRHRCKRIIGKAPTGEDHVTLLQLANILFAPDAEYHKRKKGVSRWIENILRLCRFANDNLHSALSRAGWIVHYCWDDELQCPCCGPEAAIGYGGQNDGRQYVLASVVSYYDMVSNGRAV